MGVPASASPPPTSPQTSLRRNVRRKLAALVVCPCHHAFRLPSRSSFYLLNAWCLIWVSAYSTTLKMAHPHNPHSHPSPPFSG